MCDKSKITEFKKDILAEIMFFSSDVRGDHSVIQTLCDAMFDTQLDELLKPAIFEQCKADSISFQDICDFMLTDDFRLVINMDNPKYLSWYIAYSLKQHNIDTISLSASEDENGNKECFVKSIDGNFLFQLPYCEETILANNIFQQTADINMQLKAALNENEMLRKQLLETHDLFAETYNIYVRSSKNTNGSKIKEHLSDLMELLGKPRHA
ncbi:hypothetical protein [Photobacterium damselae]|uniref:hypothetical protein n=1 Tax=Photobacterium damselae TaxID=38293 RepID=UPI0040690DCC